VTNLNDYTNNLKPSKTRVFVDKCIFGHSHFRKELLVSSRFGSKPLVWIAFRICCFLNIQTATHVLFLALDTDFTAC